MKIIYHIYIMKMCPPGYHHNGFVATHALGHHCGDNQEGTFFFPKP